MILAMFLGGVCYYSLFEGILNKKFYLKYLANLKDDKLNLILKNDKKRNLVVSHILSLDSKIFTSSEKLRILLHKEIFDKLTSFNMYYVLTKVKDKEKLCEALLNDDIFVSLFNDNYSMLFNTHNMRRLFDSIDVDELKLRFLNKTKNIKTFSVIVDTIIDDNIKKKIIDQTNDMEKKCYLISALTSDLDKGKYLDNLEFGNFHIYKILDSMKDDNICFKYLPLLGNRDRVSLVKKLKDDNLKKIYINDPVFSLYKPELVASVKDKGYIKKMFFEGDCEFQVDLLTYLTDEKFKIQLFEQMEHGVDNLRLTSIILEGCHDKNLRYKIANKINDNCARTIVFSNKKENKQKMLDKTKVTIPLEIDSDITFGVELECCHENYIHYQKLGKMLGGWQLKKELSVVGGLELTSPILHFDYNSLRELKTICDFLEKNEFTTNKACGGHIHIGFDYFKTSSELKMLYTIFSSCEDILFDMCNRKNTTIREKGLVQAKLLPKEVIEYAKNMEKEKLDKAVLNLKNLQINRSYDLNINNASNYKSKRTIEFRFPNGEINYNELLYNVIMLTTLVSKSKSLANDKKIDERISLLTSDISNDEKAKHLLDLLFSDNSIKNVYMDRYNVNKILRNDKEQILVKEKH